MPETPITTPTAAAKAPPKSLMLWVVAIAAVLTAFLGGLYLGCWMSGGAKEGGAGYQAGYDAAEAKLIELGLAREPMPVMSASGHIAEVTDDSIKMNVVLMPDSPLDSEQPVALTVKIGAETKIVIRESLPQEEIEAAMERYDEAQRQFMMTTMIPGEGEAAPPEPPMPPQTYKESAGSMSDLKTGIVVSVTVNEDIRTNSAVTAKEIMLTR